MSHDPRIKVDHVAEVCACAGAAHCLTCGKLVAVKKVLRHRVIGVHKKA